MTVLLITPAEILVESVALIRGPATPPTPPALEVTVRSTSVPRSPGSIVVFVANGTPIGSIIFTLDGSIVFTDELDSQGALNGVTIPVDVATAGVYPLLVEDVTTGLTVTVNITVTSISTPTSIGVPLESPPPAVQNTLGTVKKWVFQDLYTNQVYHFPINPDQMTAPFGKKRITYSATTAVDGQKIAYEGAAPPVEWRFSGNALTKAHYDALTLWFKKEVRIWITDHYGRAWLCYISDFTAVPKRSVQFPYRHTYEITAIVFQGPETPVVTP